MLLLTDLASADQSTGTLSVRVNGFSTYEGELRIALYNNENIYNQRDNTYRSADLPVTSPEVKWEIIDLPFGEYAIMLYHDTNNNFKFDKNFLGLPQEAYGFSNDAKPIFGPPAFSKAKFNFNRPNKTIVINLQ